MIRFNKTDFNLDTILAKTNLLELETVPEYYIFGLKKVEGKRCIEISYSYQAFPHFYDLSYYLELFFNINKIYCKAITGGNYKPKNPNIVKIGLRKDVREYVNLSALIIETAINVFEKRIKFGEREYNRKIVGLPVFDKD